MPVSARLEAVTIRSKAFWLPFIAIAVVGLIVGGLLIHASAVVGAPAEIPWQRLGSAMTAYP
jgi:hypothetical protein